MTADVAMRLNVINDYTYTLETIVQAGREKMAITWVPVRTNEELRPSKLMGSSWSYVKKSILIILRSYMMYYPLKFFTYLSIPPITAGIIVWIRFLYYVLTIGGAGHIQSLILGCTLMIIGFLTLVMGFIGDLQATNRRLLSDIHYKIRRDSITQSVD